MASISSIAQSGMSAAMLRLGSAAHNIANASTADFRRQTVHQEAQPSGGVAAGLTQALQPGGDLARDLVEQMVAAYSFKANLGVIQTEHAMLGSLLDLQA